MRFGINLSHSHSEQQDIVYRHTLYLLLILDQVIALLSYDQKPCSPDSPEKHWLGAGHDVIHERNTFFNDRQKNLMKRQQYLNNVPCIGHDNKRM